MTPTEPCWCGEADCLSLHGGLGNEPRFRAAYLRTVNRNLRTKLAAAEAELARTAEKPAGIPITDCANTLCPNKAHAGHFALLQIVTGKNVGNGTRTVTLVLCAPCAAALEGVLK